MFDPALASLRAIVAVSVVDMTVTGRFGLCKSMGVGAPQGVPSFVLGWLVN